MKAISTLEEGVPVTYDVKADFVVLCANCHRMIHRTDGPSDLDGFTLTVPSEMLRSRLRSELSGARLSAAGWQVKFPATATELPALSK